jgi:formylglycine-generating enzyme required for sulfatase activity
LKRIIVLLFLLTGFAAKSQSIKSYDEVVPGTGIKFKMVAVPAGSFMMGSPETETGRDADEGPQKKVQLGAFWIGEHEVTFAEWDAFFKNMNVPQTKAIAVDAVTRPTAQYIDLTWGMGRDSQNPTNSMSQQAALMYCKWLYQESGVFFRLPTEAEWEYSCKAGEKAPAVDLVKVGYFKENSSGKYHKVKQLRQNAWGIFDMLGNLSEWTLDQYDPAALSKLTDNTKDPVVGPTTRYPKVVKGGSYLDEGKQLRCSNRIASEAAWNKRDPQIPKSKWWLTDGMGVGFRIVKPAAQPSKEEIEKFFNLYLK